MENNRNERSIKIVDKSIRLLEYTKATPPKLFDEVGQSYFEKGYQTIAAVCEYLITLDFDIYPSEIRMSIQSGVNNMLSYFENIAENKAAASNSERFRMFSENYYSFWNYINPYIAFTSINNILTNEAMKTSVRLSAIETSASETLKRIENEIVHLDNLKSEIETIAQTARSAAQEVIVTRFGSIYETMAKKHRGNANLWLIVALAFIGGLAFLSYFTLEEGIKFMEEHEHMLRYPATMAIWIGARLIFFTALSVGVGVCISNYRANRHNQILNKHRQNALSTFETFVKSSGEDPAIKDAILMEVTRTIFSPQATGFSSSESEGESQSKIVEIVKNISGNKD